MRFKRRFMYSAALATVIGLTFLPTASAATTQYWDGYTSPFEEKRSGVTAINGGQAYCGGSQNEVNFGTWYAAQNQYLYNGKGTGGTFSTYQHTRTSNVYGKVYWRDPGGGQGKVRLIGKYSN